MWRQLDNLQSSRYAGPIYKYLQDIDYEINSVLLLYTFHVVCLEHCKCLLLFSSALRLPIYNSHVKKFGR